MSRKSIFGALAVAAGVSAAVAVKLYKDTRKRHEEKKDDEIHFITIDSDDEKKETASEDVSGKSDEVKEVCAVFPFLKPEFVEEVLVKDAEFKELTGEDNLVTVNHYVTFTDYSKMEQFVAIMDEAGYAIEVEASEAKVTRKFFAQQGAITSDILNVANQTAALNGEYNRFELE